MGNVDIHYRKYMHIKWKNNKDYDEFLLQELINNKTTTLQKILQKLQDKYKCIDLITT